MKTILVTGGAGYIGSHTVVKLLEQGYGAVIVDNLCNSKVNAIHQIESITGRKPVFYEGDVRDKGTYRYVLYDVFGFDMDSYVLGMNCGYMSIHNAIVDIDEFEKLKLENYKLKEKLEECGITLT